MSSIIGNLMQNINIFQLRVLTDSKEIIEIIMFAPINKEQLFFSIELMKFYIRKKTVESRALIAIIV